MKYEKKIKNSSKGITLITLVIIVIVLLILAGVTVVTLTGNNGILNEATKAVSVHTKMGMKEELELEITKLKIEYEANKKLKENYSKVGNYIKDQLKGYEFFNESQVKYNETEDNFSFDLEEGKGTFGIDEKGNIIDLAFPEMVSSGNQKDVVAPVVKVISTTTNSITFQATDSRGVMGYGVTEENQEPTNWETIEKTKELEKTITGLINNKTYYLWAKDEAGNISEVQTAKTTDFETLTYTTSWSETTATITITSPSLGVQYRIGSTGNWINYATGVAVESGTTVQFMVTDGTNITTATSVTPRKTGLQVSYHVNTGTGGVPTNKTYTHEDKVTVDFTTLPTKTGYTFNGWSTNQNASTAEYTVAGTTTFNMPVNNVTLYAIWIPNTGTAYKVIHRQMNVTGSGYTTVEIENLKGTTGTSITPAVKSYVGFTAPEVKTETITGDGNTLVTYDYTRNQYMFTLEEREGVNSKGSSSIGKYYYGAELILNAELTEDYVWKKWVADDSKLSSSEKYYVLTMPAHSLTIYPLAVYAKEITLLGSDIGPKYNESLYRTKEGIFWDVDGQLGITGYEETDKRFIPLPVCEGKIFAGFYDQIRWYW